MLSIKEKLKPPSDRYTGNEYIEAWDLLPEDVNTAIPGCLWQDGMMRFDVLRVLLLIPARREDPNITIEQIGEGICDENLLELVEEVMYFWTSMTREEIRKQREEVMAIVNTQREEADPLA